ncbi:MAG TPA: nickel pincer cofactor biosynthesis protein LarC [Candidatus Bathyarchaeia archaeon]
MPESNRITVIDCQIAGVSGDMFLGALIDLGADVDKIVCAIKSLENKTSGYKDVKVIVKKVVRKGFSATKIDVTAEGTSKKDASELIEIVEKTSQTLKLTKKAQQFASNTIRTLIHAEAQLHKKNLTDAHLHEVGLIDTPAEIIGITVALDDLDLFDSRIYATPVSVGGGLFKFSHGIVSSPAPATLKILQRSEFPIHGGPVESELTTPTGAAILVNLAEEISAFYPAMTPLKTGYGAGNKDFPEMPNVLRITVGKTSDYSFLQDEVAVLETNLDDVTGEVVGNSVERLIHEGAKDVCIIPMFTKKNRPGQIVKVIAEKKDVEHLVQVMIEETGTLGVRVYPCERRIANRESVTVNVLIEKVRDQVKVKFSKDAKGRIIRVKPEYDDAKRLAVKTGKTLREITDTVTAKAKDVLLEK